MDMNTSQYFNSTRIIYIWSLKDSLVDFLSTALFALTECAYPAYPLLMGAWNAKEKNTAKWVVVAAKYEKLSLLYEMGPQDMATRAVRLGRGCCT